MISNIKRYLLEYLDEHPLQRGFIFSIMGKAHPVFIDYPVNIKPRYGYGNLPHEKLHEIINKNRNTKIFLFIFFHKFLTIKSKIKKIIFLKNTFKTNFFLNFFIF